MRVTLPKDYKRNYSICEVEAMRATIKFLRDNYDEKPETILAEIAKAWTKDNCETLRYCDIDSVSVLTCETCTYGALPYDRLCDNSANTDVVISGFVNYYRGTLRIYVSLANYWEHGTNCEPCISVALYND